MAKKLWILLFTSFIVYSGFVYTHCDQAAIVKPDTHVKNGWKVWQEKNCQGCHQVYGLGGYMGPDLTNVATEKGAVYMQGFIKYGTGRMPNLNIRDEDIRDLIAFLSWVDKSGKSTVSADAVHWSGTYIIK